MLVALRTRSTTITSNSKQLDRIPWNKGRLIGPKPPLLPKHVWSIRTRLQLIGKTRDLALFNLAIDSKLRGCDVVALKAEDVAPAGYATDRAIIRQRKTGRPVKFELTDQTRQSIDDYLKNRWKRTGEFLFPSRQRPGRNLSTRQYARFCHSGSRALGWIQGSLAPIHFVGRRRR